MKIHFGLGCLFALVLCSGCGTVMTHYGSRDTCMSFRGEGLYQGVRLDWIAVNTPQAPLAPVFVFDLPLSLAADTVVLPYDIVDSAGRKKERGNSDRNKSAR
jgi:uncharacterized protein YceK